MRLSPNKQPISVPIGLEDVLSRDYLGSITHIATADGTLVTEYSYDPWGRLRSPQTLALYSASSAPALFLGRGYTGHEHLAEFGLINMNARLIRAFNNFGKHVEGFNSTDVSGNYTGYWDHNPNPIKGIDWAHFNGASNKAVLNNQLVPSAWDYYASIYGIIGDPIRGIINSARDNKKY